MIPTLLNWDSSSSGCHTLSPESALVHLLSTDHHSYITYEIYIVLDNRRDHTYLDMLYIPLHSPCSLAAGICPVTYVFRKQHRERKIPNSYTKLGGLAPLVFFQEA